MPGQPTAPNPSSLHFAAIDSPPRPLEEIESDIRGIEKNILKMLAEVTGRETLPA